MIKKRLKSFLALVLVAVMAVPMSGLGVISKAEEEFDIAKALNDPEFLESVLIDNSSDVQSEETAAEDVVSVTLNKTHAEVELGSVETFVSTIYPTGATPEKVFWYSTDTRIASITQDGKMVAKQLGTVGIRVLINDTIVSACRVKIVPEKPKVDVQSVTFADKIVRLTVGDTQTLKATVSPENASKPEITWNSSNTEVATVVNGVITAKSAGAATITASADGKTAYCTIIVSKPIVAVENVVLNKTSLALSIGDTEKLTASIVPSNATTQTITWTSSDSAVAAVTSSGTVTAKAAGTAIITASVDGKSTTCTVVVSPSAVLAESVTLDKSSVSLTVGGTETLTASISPSNTTNQTITWTSSNTAVAAVSNGTVTAKSAGTATITASVDGKSASCTVTVSNAAVAVESVSLNKTSITLSAGGTETLTASVSPSNATNKTITWTSSNTSVATVSNGVITAVSAGTAIITATADGKSASCTVTVSGASVAVESVSLNKTSITLTVDSTETLTATVSPSNATNKTVTWTSSNTSVASVSSSGKITAKAVGTTTITAAADGKSATCAVTVEAAKEDKTKPPYPFWKNYISYANSNTYVYYKGNIYYNKWYASVGEKPTSGDPWVLVGPAEWTLPDDEAYYTAPHELDPEKVTEVGKVVDLTDEEIQENWGGINEEYSPEKTFSRVEALISKSDYESLFPYRFGSDGWKSEQFEYSYVGAVRQSKEDYYSYENLKTAITELANKKIKVEYRTGRSYATRVTVLDKTEKTELVAYKHEEFDLSTNAIVSQIVDYGTFLAEGTANDKKRELAAFLANCSHETGGGKIWTTTTNSSIDEIYTGLYWNEEVTHIGATQSDSYTNVAYPYNADKSYHGRGPIQISWNYNYSLFSGIVYGDPDILLNEPEKVLTETKLGFMSAIWFWMTPQPPKPSCHEVILSDWKPITGYQYGFGATIMIINGGLEGNLTEADGRVGRRIRYYRHFSNVMGADITGEKLDTLGLPSFY